MRNHRRVMPRWSSMLDPVLLEQFYDVFPRIEEDFQAALNVSLNPRGPEMLCHLVRDLRLPPGSTAIDVGCGQGRHALPLDARFGFVVAAFDPLQRHIELANGALAAVVEQQADLSSRVSFGSAWRRLCRSMVPASISCGAGTCSSMWPSSTRLMPNSGGSLGATGRVLVYQMFVPSDLSRGMPCGCGRRWGVVPTSGDPQRTDRAIATAGLRIEERIDVGTDWGEWAEETAGTGSRRLLNAARLLRAPDRYLARFGQAAYDIMLADELWQVYGMIGKLNRRVYLLSGQ